jgi:serpin B
MLSLLTAALVAASPPTGVVDGNGDFAIDLYQQLAKDAPGNLFFSPFSISDALAMTYGGAATTTAEQMAKALHFGAGTHEGFSLLNADLKSGKGYQLSVANRLFAQKGLPLLPAYTKLVATSYGAPVEALDFANAGEPSRKHINDWVETQTQKRIKDLLPPGVINAATRLVLANAIYFKGTWAHAFDKKDTRPMPFHLAGGKSADVPMMTQELVARYHDGASGQIVELPYAGGALSMVVFVPKADLASTKLDRRLFDGSLNSSTDQDVRVYLPRFKMTGELRLDDTLKALGMTEAFTPRADFSGIDGDHDLYISAVVHKAFVEVNEEGTEAAAATGVVMAAASVERVPEVRADHPFVFALRDNRTGSILFLGRVADPRG